MIIAACDYIRVQYGHCAITIVQNMVYVVVLLVGGLPANIGRHGQSLLKMVVERHTQSKD